MNPSEKIRKVGNSFANEGQRDAAEHLWGIANEVAALESASRVILEKVFSDWYIADYSRFFGAQRVYCSWRDNMLAQGREIKTEQRYWDTLPDQDKVLDARIALAVITDFALYARANPPRMPPGSELLDSLGLFDWAIVECDDPWCNHSTKTLYVYSDDSQCLIHEATHALVGGGHRQHFWTLFEAILDFYLGESLNEMQAKMKTDYLGVNDG